MRQKNDLFTLDLFDQENERGKPRSITKADRNRRFKAKRKINTLPNSKNFGEHYFYKKEF